MTRLSYCQDRWEEPPDDDDDEFEQFDESDVIEQALEPETETEAEQDLRARFAEADWLANRLKGRL